MEKITKNDVFGFVKPSLDAHVLGILNISKLITDCGFEALMASSKIVKFLDQPTEENFSVLKKWLLDNKITRLGFSYRLDPGDAKTKFDQLFSFLKKHELLGNQIKSLYFAGLPEAGKKIKKDYGDQVLVFWGDENSVESLEKIEIPKDLIPKNIKEVSAYDEERLIFAKKIIDSGEYLNRKPIDRSGYEDFGTKSDSIAKRISYVRKNKQLPLIRVHVGPYDKDYAKALRDFQEWIKILAQDGWLDILSIGSSQLSQSDFGLDWKDKPNGGGVPINSEQDLINIYEASRPMLVRTYAGTKNVPQLAELYEKTINMAWHALSFWWFCQIDGRGPHTVRYNLDEHFETLKIIADHNKPFEPNIPHHFAFRGADDYSYVLSGLLAAKTAKKLGVKYFVIQNMLNTPKYTWGVQDLAKSRALLKLVKELEDDNFSAFLQPRAGLDYFSPDPYKAKIQLASVSAMMDDIDPLNELSPDIVHVVSYSEGISLATPEIIEESIKITLQAIEEYRQARSKGEVTDMSKDKEVERRTADLVSEVRKIVQIIEQAYPDLYTPQGMYDIFKDGIMPVPYLWEGREEFAEAIKWKTALVDGGMKVVDDNGQPISPSDRVAGIVKDKK
ncbi:MAG: cobalamin-binding protein [Patescibacteria group bacterium]|jgi:hypothetical protein